MDDVHDTAIRSFFAFLAIMSPVANAPVFLGVTTGLEAAQRRRVAVFGVLVATLLAASFAFAGSALMHAFGITIPAVRAFGGIIVAKIGFDLITSSASTSHQPVSDTPDSGLGAAVSPLAIPILAGPGTLATTLGLTAGGGLTHQLVVVASFVAVAILNLVGFLLAERLVDLVGKELIGATTKIMGIVLGAIGVQMALEGAQAVLGS